MKIFRTKSPAVANVGRPYRLHLKASLRSWKKAISQSDYTPINATVTLRYQTLKSTLGLR